MKIEYKCFSSAGLVRSDNQDSIFSAVSGEYGLFAIADGMGGHFGGEIASGRLTDELETWWNSFLFREYSFERCCDELKKLMYDVNESIYNEFTNIGQICGTTVGLVFIFGERYLLINSGDTRIYSRRGLKIKQESTDHVYGTEKIISGQMTKSEAAASPDRNKLTAAIGSKSELKMYVASSPLKHNCFIICSDGVYKYCKIRNIVIALYKSDPEKYISHIVNSRGARDNYSFIIIKIKGIKRLKRLNTEE